MPYLDDKVFLCAKNRRGGTENEKFFLFLLLFDGWGFLFGDFFVFGVFVLSWFVCISLFLVDYFLFNIFSFFFFFYFYLMISFFNL